MDVVLAKIIHFLLLEVIYDSNDASQSFFDMAKFRFIQDCLLFPMFSALYSLVKFKRTASVYTFSRFYKISHNHVVTPR